MMKGSHSVWLLPVVIACSFAQASRDLVPDRKPTVQSWPDRAKRYALIVGVDAYDDPQINQLSGAARDAATLSDALVTYSGFPKDQVVILASNLPNDRQPTRGNILRRLSNLRAAIPKDGLLFFSFAGHGIERGGKAYLLPRDAQLSGDIALLEDTAIPVSAISDRIRQSGVSQVIVLLDACRNDPSSGRSAAANPLSTAFTKPLRFDAANKDITAFATIYATEIGHRAYEYTSKGQGYFTWALIDGLSGAAADSNGDVRLSRLIKYVQETVPKKTSLDLGVEKTQRPFAVVEGYKADDLVIAVRTAGPAKPAPNNVAAPPTVRASTCAVPEPRPIDKPLPMELGVTCTIELDQGEQTYYRAELPPGDYKLVVDARRKDGKRSNLISTLSVLDSRGAVVEDRAIHFNEVQVDFREVDRLSVRRKQVLQFRLTNDHDAATFWFTIANASAPLVPFFGSLLPTTIGPGEASSGFLRTHESVYRAIALDRGTYSIAFDLENSQRKAINLIGDVYILDGDGARLQSIGMNEVNVFHRQVGSLALKQPAKLILRTYFNGGSEPNRVKYTVRVSSSAE